MTNHPNRSRTYWYISERGFANEYTVGIATNRVWSDYYANLGYDRIDRARALRELTNRGDNATEIYAGVTVNGNGYYDRFEMARDIRAGR
jgi:hypothetical protein